MSSLIDYILNLFRSEDAARAFAASPQQALNEAGFADVSPAQVSSVAASAVPGLQLGGGDPIVGLQQAVSSHFGLAAASNVSAAAGGDVAAGLGADAGAGLGVGAELADAVGLGAQVGY
ncbi:IniB N-terminal domain-containing protein, partial [Mycobacterium parascrofulaceum]|uniref:IniB N-terminal domain-containing protein n=1 Tax=Mycobacterium parascrofulaceum TaxID=240125 RepID=UPI00058FE37D